ncbi:MAG: class I SAM-dependent methyltransferase [Armatimonadetes bacterium]|nr:class I SAM-dependent methyltransferase [Armatimonadota bacterium]
MNLLDIIRRNPAPQPWSEGDDIPWHDARFSERMLREHLSQAHDHASRRFEIIDRQVDWIHRKLLQGRASRILDLGCGPGLHTERLASRGHNCIGIDYSPASVEYARKVAETGRLACAYRLEDIRYADFGSGFDLAMLLFGEFNVFRPEVALDIVRRAKDALTSDGLLLLEPHSYDAVARTGGAGSSWHTSESGLFGDRPYLCLEENLWNFEAKTATSRYYIVNADGSVESHSHSYQAYTDEEYRQILKSSGFKEVDFYPSLLGVPDESQAGLMAVVAGVG